MKSKILLTGATGYIGYNIAKQLLQTGYSLRFFVRNPKDCILGMNAEIITGDIRCYSDVELVLTHIFKVKYSVFGYLLGLLIIGPFFIYFHNRKDLKLYKKYLEKHV